VDAVRARLQLASGSPAKRQPESSARSVPPVTRSDAASRPAAAWHVDLDEGASCDVRLDYLESGCSLLIGMRQTGWRTAGSAERHRASCGDVTPTCAGPVTCRCGGEGRQRYRWRREALVRARNRLRLRRRLRRRLTPTKGPTTTEAASLQAELLGGGVTLR